MFSFVFSKIAVYYRTIIIRAVEQLIFLIALIARLIVLITR